MVNLTYHTQKIKEAWATLTHPRRCGQSKLLPHTTLTCTPWSCDTTHKWEELIATWHGIDHLISPCQGHPGQPQYLLTQHWPPSLSSLLWVATIEHTHTYIHGLTLKNKTTYNPRLSNNSSNWYTPDSSQHLPMEVRVHTNSHTFLHGSGFYYCSWLSHLLPVLQSHSKYSFPFQSSILIPSIPFHSNHSHYLGYSLTLLLVGHDWSTVGVVESDCRFPKAAARLATPTCILHPCSPVAPPQTHPSSHHHWNTHE